MLHSLYEIHLHCLAPTRRCVLIDNINFPDDSARAQHFLDRFDSTKPSRRIPRRGAKCAMRTNSYSYAALFCTMLRNQSITEYRIIARVVLRLLISITLLYPFHSPLIHHCCLFYTRGGKIVSTIMMKGIEVLEILKNIRKGGVNKGLKFALLSTRLCFPIFV